MVSDVFENKKILNAVNILTKSVTTEKKALPLHNIKNKLNKTKL